MYVLKGFPLASYQCTRTLQNEEYTVQDLKGLTAPYNRIFLDRGGIISLPLIIPGSDVHDFNS